METKEPKELGLLKGFEGFQPFLMVPWFTPGVFQGTKRNALKSVIQGTKNI